MATILIVDDRPSNRQFLVTLLGYLGHRMLEAGDGAEALRLVSSAQPALDTGMPLVAISAGLVALVAVVWWMASLMTRPRIERRPQPARAYVPRQPWNDDKPGGRGNR